MSCSSTFGCLCNRAHCRVTRLIELDGNASDYRARMERAVASSHFSSACRVFREMFLHSLNMCFVCRIVRRSRALLRSLQ